MIVSGSGWKAAAAVAVLAAQVGLAACGGLEGADVRADYPSDNSATTGTYDNKPYGNIRDESLFGDGGIVLFGGPDYDAARAAETGGGAGIGVNAWLWRASLDTLSFMPFTSADPFGGVIITDWYAPPGAPGERYKATAFILERALRADGVRVSVFRQVSDDGANWRDAPVGESLAADLEDTILTRARQLRIRATAATAGG